MASYVKCCNWIFYKILSSNNKENCYYYFKFSDEISSHANNVICIKDKVYHFYSEKVLYVVLRSLSYPFDKEKFIEKVLTYASFQ